MSYYDQMKPVEQDQAITAKAMEQFKKLVQEYPESRYATDALAKIDICRGRLAQKELWVADLLLQPGQPERGAPAARARAEGIPAHPGDPGGALPLAEVYSAEGTDRGRAALLRQLADEYPYTEWGTRAAQRLRAATR